MNEVLPKLTNFILPGGSKASSLSHICRSVTRRAERKIVKLEIKELEIALKYLNRLSDYFFVLARYFNHLENQKDQIWKSN